MKPEKVIRNGQVAILVSSGFGAGWSTWNSEYADFLAFDAGLVKLADEGADAATAEAYVKSKLGDDCYVYMGGWPVDVEWLPEGTPFYIHEYDGYESIKYAADLTMTA